MFVVLLILLATTAIATFGVHSTTFELRAAGYGKRALQTHYVAEAGLASATAWVDLVGPQALLHAMRQSSQPTMTPYEPNLLPGKSAYRMYLDDFSAVPGAEGDAIERRVAMVPSFGPMQAYAPRFVVDINDDYTYTGAIAGQRSDGYGTLQFMAATYTSRGRMTVAGGDYRNLTAGLNDRDYHEGASDARGYAVSGPFGK